MTLKEIINLGYTEVIVKASGYQEVGIFGCWQPFKSIRSITFKINPEFMDIENRTFWINNAERQNYEIKDNQVILWEPDVFARCDY